MSKGAFPKSTKKIPKTSHFLPLEYSCVVCTKHPPPFLYKIHKLQKIQKFFHFPIDKYFSLWYNVYVLKRGHEKIKKKKEVKQNEKNT